MPQRTNVYYKLRQKEYYVNTYRNNRKIIRTLVCSNSARFVKVWEKHSKQTISCEGNIVYFENYKKCYTLCGYKRRPSLLYKLPPCPTSHKIEDALICKYPLEEIPLEHKGYRSSFLALTAHNWLLRYDLQNGSLLQQIYLSPKYRFRHVTWDSEHRVVVRSTHTRPSSQGNHTNNVLMAVAVFTVFPVEFVAMMEVTRQVFGRDITDSLLSQGILIVMYQGGIVRLYSFDYILSQGKKFSGKLDIYCDDLQGQVGSHPTGLPLNIQLSERPPVLFEVRCADHYLQLGGIPWHYILTPYGCLGVFKVFTLETKKQVENGCLEMISMSVEPERALFHADDSGRIIHIGANEVRVFRLSSCGSTGKNFSLKECYSINAQIQTPKEDNTRTSSGRVVKRSKNYMQLLDSNHEHIIRATDYEVDLELMMLTCVYDHGEDCHGVLALYDNLTGQKVKEIAFPEHWKEHCEHDLIMDMDTIVHITKAPARHFTCAVYVLDRTLDE